MALPMVMKRPGALATQAGFWLAVVILVGACADQGTHAATSATPTSSTTPVSAGLTCEMPFISSSDFVNSGQSFYGRSQGTAGFLKLTDGSFRADPNGALVQDAGPQYQYRTVAQPVLPGDPNGNRWWDPSANRWLPVPSPQIAPDGTSYVYNIGPEVHVVTVATGADRLIFEQPSGVAPIWLVYRGDGILMTINNQYKGGGGSVITVPAEQVGVWRLDPGGAAPQRIDTQPLAGFIGAGTYLWQVENETLVRYDLASTRRDSWFFDAGRGMQLLAIDPAGNPIVWTYGLAPGQVQQGLLEIWVISGHNDAKQFYSETYGGVPHIYGINTQDGPLAVDRHGVWFGSTMGLYLLDTTGFHKVADAPGIPVGLCR
jgi:hypothetical protein